MKLNSLTRTQLGGLDNGTFFNNTYKLYETRTEPDKYPDKTEQS